MQSRLSVIIPGYNTPKEWWERCLKGVLAALPEDGEIICVDDGSRERPIVKITDARIKWLYLEKNIGQSAARNVAMRVASGKYLAFVDSDDELVSNIYQEVIQNMEEDSSDVGLFGVRVIWQNEGLYKEDVPVEVHGKCLSLQDVDALFRGCLFEYVWNRVFRREFLEKNDIKFDEGVCPGEDTIFNLNTVISGAKFSSLRKVGYVYYRYFTSSLARYQPEFQRSLRLRNGLWRNLKGLLAFGSTTAPKLGELDNRELSYWYAENVWRYDSPISYADRWKEFGGGRVFIKMLVKSFLRKYLYIKSVRRKKIKMMFPAAKEIRLKKFVAVMNIPSPYRLHLLGALAQQLEAKGIEFCCHFMNHGHKDRPKSWLNPKIPFAHTYWRNFGPDQHEFNPGLVLKMLFEKPDYLLLGGVFDTFTNIALAISARAGTKICWLEGNTKTPGRLTGPLGWFKRALMGRCRLAAVPSSDAAKYIGLHQALTKKQMPKPVYLPNLVDETRFGKVVDCRLKVEDKKICLIPARLEPVKGLVPFFELLTPEMLKGWKIRLMGQGPLKGEIEEVLAKRGIREFVEIVDYVPYDEMPQHYATADLLLLPSIYDPNPLSVIEALHTGLAVAVSDRAGNVEEAVAEGKNGWVLPVLDDNAFAAKLKVVFAADKVTLKKLGEVSKAENARFWDTRTAIARFMDAI